MNRFCQSIRMFLCVLCVATIAACAKEEPDTSAIHAFVSILPQVEFVRRVGGDRVSVEALVAPGQQAETYAPTPSQLAALSRADLYFRIGVPFEEAFIPRIAGSLKNLRVVDTREGIELRDMAEGHEDGESSDHEHAHGGKDPHTWLDPLLVARQAQTIRDALIELDPAGKSEYVANCSAFETDLQALDAELRETLAPLKGEPIFVFHPAFGYFAGRYGLRQIAVELQGKDPGPRDLAEFISLARERGARVVFVQPQFSQKSAKTVAEAIGGAVVALDPLAADYMKNMRDMAAKIRAALAGEGAR